MADWIRLEKGIYYRDYGDVKTWRLQGSHNGVRIFDCLGSMPLAEVRKIKAELEYNRKNDVPPFSYNEMLEERNRADAAKKLEQKKSEEKALLEDARRRAATVGAFRERCFWPHRLSLSRSEKENRTMDGRWRNHIAPFFADIPMADAQKGHFFDFLEILRAKKPPLSPQTIHKCLTDLRQIWAYAWEEGWVDRPFPGKAVIREQLADVDSEKKCWLTPDEARLLLRTVHERRLKSRNDHDVYCYVVLGLGLGLRAGDIDKLTRQAVERHIIDRTKNKRARFVHFNFGPVQAMLDERLAIYPPDSPNDRLFKTQQNGFEPRPRSGVPRKFFDIIKELGFNDHPKRIGHRLEKIDFHALRHTFATLAAMRGVDHVTLMRLMGHKTLSMTLRYIEIADAYQAKHQEKAMEGIFPDELGEKEGVTRDAVGRPAPLEEKKG